MGRNLLEQATRACHDPSDPAFASETSSLFWDVVRICGCFVGELLFSVWVSFGVQQLNIPWSRLGMRFVSLRRAQ